MSVTEDTQWFEAELEQSKQKLHEDLAQMATRLHQTRVRLRPNNVLGVKPFPLMGISVLSGLLLGYWNVPFQDIGQLVARAMLVAAGKQIAVRAIRG
jgi:hypothetical protein